MNLHAVPSDIHLAMDTYSPKQSDNDPLGGVDVAFDIVQVKFLWAQWGQKLMRLMTLPALFSHGAIGATGT